MKKSILPMLMSLLGVIATPKASYAYLISDFGFTNVSNAGLKASVHSLVYFDQQNYPQLYDYEYIVTNTGPAGVAGQISEFGVVVGNLLAANVTEFQAAPPGPAGPTNRLAKQVGKCTAGGALPAYVSNATRPSDAGWCFTVKDDGKPIPTDFAALWTTMPVLNWQSQQGANSVFTFDVFSVNAPITGQPFIDAPESGSFIISGGDPPVTFTQNYVPEPSSLSLLGFGLVGVVFFIQRRRRLAPKLSDRLAGASRLRN